MISRIEINGDTTEIHSADGSCDTLSRFHSKDYGALIDDLFEDFIDCLKTYEENFPAEFFEMRQSYSCFTVFGKYLVVDSMIIHTDKKIMYTEDGIFSNAREEEHVMVILGLLKMDLLDCYSEYW